MKTLWGSCLALLCVWALFTSQADASESCVSLTAKAESLADQGVWPSAKAAAQRAIDSCKQEKQKTARPYMVMAVAANASNDSFGVIKWSKEALVQEPDSAGLAHMNICSAYYVLKKYDDAIAACEAGLSVKSAHPWKGKINYNLGLAVFNKNADSKNPADVAKAEPYFRETIELEPKFGGAYHYVGVIEAGAKGNAAEGIKYFKMACERGYEQGCEWAKKWTATSASTSGYSAEENQLFGQLKKNYLEKGLPASSVDQMIVNFKTSLASVPPGQRVQTLRQMVAASK